MATELLVLVSYVPPSGVVDVSSSGTPSVVVDVSSPSGYGAPLKLKQVIILVVTS